MKLKIGGTCECGCDQKSIFIFRSKLFQFRWFLDYGDWFLYIHFGKKYFRFSSAGFIKGKTLK